MNFIDKYPFELLDMRGKDPFFSNLSDMTIFYDKFCEHIKKSNVKSFVVSSQLELYAYFIISKHDSVLESVTIFHKPEDKDILAMMTFTRQEEGSRGNYATGYFVSEDSRRTGLANFVVEHAINVFESIVLEHGTDVALGYCSNVKHVLNTVVDVDNEASNRLARKYLMDEGDFSIGIEEYSKANSIIYNKMICKPRYKSLNFHSR